MSEVTTAVFPALAGLEASLSLPRGTIAQLAEADDWTGIIKTAALLEAAIFDAMSHTWRGEAQKEWLERQVRDGLKRKVEVASAWGLIDDYQRDILELLADARNKAAHGRSGLTFSFEGWLKDAKIRAKFNRVLKPWPPGIYRSELEQLILMAIVIAVRLFESKAARPNLNALLKALEDVGVPSVFEPVRHDGEGH